MCRCCQSCFEDCYWYCIEERFCFDKNIANYSADEDEYLTKRNGKGFNDFNLDINERPICEQPGRQDTAVLSSKIREEDYRQIQTNVPFLAPEILSVFANSQIFHDHQPSKSLAIVHKSPVLHGDARRNVHSDTDNEQKLLKRLEGIDEKASNEQTDGKQQNERANNELILRPVPMIRTPVPDESSGNSDDTDTDEHHVEATHKTPILNKPLRNIQSMPYFSYRPVSETDIFTIAGNSMGQISMTPEIPAISYTTLPKYYEETPTVDKYKESRSLYSIQTAEIERAKEFDFSMPRYFGKSDFITQSVENLSSTGTRPQATPKKIEISKRLKVLRANLPPLSIHINKDKEKSRERKIE